MFNKNRSFSIKASKHKKVTPTLRSKTPINNSDNHENYNNFDIESLIDYEACKRKAYQKAIVSLPIAVKPFSCVGPTKTLCCKDPIIKNIRCSKSKE